MPNKSPRRMPPFLINTSRRQSATLNHMKLTVIKTCSRRITTAPLNITVSAVSNAAMGCHPRDQQKPKIAQPITNKCARCVMSTKNIDGVAEIRIGSHKDGVKITDCGSEIIGKPPKWNGLQDRLSPL